MLDENFSVENVALHRNGRKMPTILAGIIIWSFADIEKSCRMVKTSGGFIIFTNFEEHAAGAAIATVLEGLGEQCRTEAMTAIVGRHGDEQQLGFIENDSTEAEAGWPFGGIERLAGECRVEGERAGELHAAPAFTPGGIETYVHDLHEGIEMTIIGRQDGRRGKRVHERLIMRKFS